jgi:hypothetical protein
LVIGSRKDSTIVPFSVFIIVTLLWRAINPHFFHTTNLFLF